MGCAGCISRHSPFCQKVNLTLCFKFFSVMYCLLLFLIGYYPPARHNGNNDECRNRTKSAEARRQKICNKTDDATGYEFEFLSVLFQNKVIHQMECDACESHVRKINCQWRPRHRITANPRCRERNKRHYEQPCDIAPENADIDFLCNVEYQMVIYPVNRNKKEAEQIGEQCGQQRQKITKSVAYRLFQLQYCNCYYNREHAVAERFQSVFFHFAHPVVICTLYYTLSFCKCPSQ